MVIIDCDFAKDTAHADQGVSCKVTIFLLFLIVVVVSLEQF